MLCFVFMFMFFARIDQIYANITSITVPSTFNSKPTPGGRRIDMTAVPLHWAYNPVHTVSIAV